MNRSYRPVTTYLVSGTVLAAPGASLVLEPSAAAVPPESRVARGFSVGQCPGSRLALPPSSPDASRLCRRGLPFPSGSSSTGSQSVADAVMHIDRAARSSYARLSQNIGNARGAAATSGEC